MDDYRRADNVRDGYCIAMEVVTEIVRELPEAEASLVHDKVWRRLRDERDARTTLSAGEQVAWGET